MRALALREALPAAKHSNALRLVHGESDGLPGLVVDRYADVLVAQFLAAGRRALARADPRRARRAHRLRGDLRALRCRDAQARRPRAARGLRARQPRRVALPDHRIRPQLPVDVEQGQKTGFFLDQRENRQRVRALAAGPRSARRLLLHRRLRHQRARRRRDARHRRSKAPRRRSRWRARTWPRTRSMLREVGVRAGGRLHASAHAARPRPRSSTSIVLDPPKFAPTAAQAKNAARAYKDINLLALKLLAPGRPARHVLLLGRSRRSALPVDRRRRGARRRRARPRSSSASAPPRTTRWRSSFRRASI